MADDVLLSAFLALPGVGVSLDDSDSLELLNTDVLPTARAVVETYTGRTFTPATLTRTFDAPPAPAAPSPWDSDEGTLLTVGDLIAPTAVTAFGTDLVLDTDYQLLPYTTPDGRPLFTRLQRLSGGQPVPWVTGVPLPYQPLNAISVTGTWGGFASEPLPVRQAILMLAARTWIARARLYGVQSGNADQGQTSDAGRLFSPDIKLLLDPYKAVASGGEVAFA